MTSVLTKPVTGVRLGISRKTPVGKGSPGMALEAFANGGGGRSFFAARKKAAEISASYSSQRRNIRL